VEETRSVILLTYKIDGTTFELTVIRTLLWSYNEFTNEINSTVSFVSTEITIEDTLVQFYDLSYLAQNEEYNLTVRTTPSSFGACLSPCVLGVTSYARYYGGLVSTNYIFIA